MSQQKRGLPQLAVFLMTASLLTALGILAFVYVFGQDYVNTRFEQEPVLLSTGWRLTVGETPTREEETLPINLPKGQEPFVLERELDPALAAGFTDTPALVVRASYINYSVLLDGELLESYEVPAHGYSRTSGTVYRFVSLPADWQGRTLTIRCQATIAEGLVPCTMVAPWFAPPGNFYNWVLGNEIPSLVGDVATLALGLTMLLGSFLFAKDLGLRGRFMNTGIFAILFVCYDACMTTGIHLLVQNEYFLYMLEFFALMTVPLPILRLAREVANEGATKLIDLALVVVSLNFLLQLILHFGKIYELRQLLIFDHLAILLSVCAIVAALLGKGKSKVQLQFVYSMTPLVIGGLIDLIRFYFNWTEPLNLAFRLATLVFILLQFYYAVRSYLDIYRSSVESAHFQVLAFQDGLTGIANRAAFERDVEALEADLQSHLPLWLMMCDVNGLKRINDEEGHLAGDKLLKKAAAVLTGAARGKGKVYRIGGDEFVISLVEKPEETAQALLEEIRTGSRRANKEPPELTLSVGYAGYTPGDAGRLQEVLSRADARMYEEKQQGKAAQALEESLSEL